MRRAFVSALRAVADLDDRVILLTGDLGFGVLDEFADVHPTRFINCGVAEANMMGMAAGMAARGLVPYCYSIATFASMRGYEQLRDGAALHGLPVRVVGVGGGFGYGSLGATHHAVEDVAIMRAMPGMAIVAPADDAMTRAAVPVLHAQPGPVYLRLSKDSVTTQGLSGGFNWGDIEVVGSGAVALLTYGGVSASVLAVAQSLRSRGVETKVGIVATLAPTPSIAIERVVTGVSHVITVEEHRSEGGLGSMIAEVMGGGEVRARLTRLGLGDGFLTSTGSEAFLHATIGIDAGAIERAVMAAVVSTPRS